MNRLMAICGVLALIVSLGAGCGPSGPKLVKVNGKVTLDGNPAARVSVMFRPAGTTGTTSYARTDNNGQYSLMYTDAKAGAIPGDYFVILESRKIPKHELEEMKAGGMDVPTETIEIPKKYRTPEAIKVTVKDSGNEPINIELTSGDK